VHLGHPQLGDLARHLEAARNAGDVDGLDDGAAVFDEYRDRECKVEHALLQKPQHLRPFEIQLVVGLDVGAEIAVGGLRKHFCEEWLLELRIVGQEVEGADDVELLLVVGLRLRCGRKTECSDGHRNCEQALHAFHAVRSSCLVGVSTSITPPSK
jgi:hypothetical protein